MQVDGVKDVESRHDPAETVRNLENEIAARGMRVFARIDHAAGAAEAGMELRPTLVLVFGNAKAGTPLMQADQHIGLDLPLKALVWQAENGTVMISYNDPVWLGERYGLPAQSTAGLAAIRTGLETLVKAAAGR